MRQTLLLDSSYFPLQMIDWKKALSLFFTERAEVVEHHDNVVINSTSKSYQLPKVMRLFCKLGKMNEVRFNRLNVFYRDGFTCQYCNTKFRAEELTFDHVHPKSKGGETSWENIVTACEKCNCKKSDHLAHECGMVPLKTPREPKWMSMFLLKLNQREKSIWKDWFFPP
jgi:5-methylcytosine-specific restriction endonuclease McrA